ncbi:MAG TPA: cupredoxin domain-containing protein [Nitrososphaerales archaeon]|nr:cupredoxin domain-containing protein [Nitrososphaerales archaeon]
MVSRRTFAVAGGLALLLVSALAMALPVATAQSPVVVNMLVGSGVGPSAAPGFSPENVTVVIGVNNTVTWINKDTNNGGTSHTVTSLTVPSGAASFDSGIMKEGANFTQTFTTPGTYEYHCTIHPWMTGSVIVLASTSTTSSSSAPQFPSAALALTLFAVIAAVALAASRLKGTLPTSPAATPSRVASTM